MDSKPTSNLDAAPPLPLDLSTVEEAPPVPAASTMGEFTAARFFRENPETYERIARAQAEGATDRQIVRIFRVHHETARAIRAREAGSKTDQEYRRTITASLRGGVVAIVDELQDRLANNPGAVSTRDLVSALRELNGAERVHAGAPSSIVGVVRAEGATATLEELLRQAAERRGIGLAAEKSPSCEAGEVVEAEVVEPQSALKCNDSIAQVLAISTEQGETDSKRDCAPGVQPAAQVGAGEPRAELMDGRDGRANGGGGGAARPGGSFQEDR